MNIAPHLDYALICASVVAVLICTRNIKIVKLEDTGHIQNEPFYRTIFFGKIWHTQRPID